MNSLEGVQGKKKNRLDIIRDVLEYILGKFQKTSCKFQKISFKLQKHSLFILFLAYKYVHYNGIVNGKWLTVYYQW